MLAKMTKKKEILKQIRCSEEFDKEIRKWLELHTTYDFSKFARTAIEEKMSRETPLKSQFEELVELFDTKLQILKEDIINSINKKESGKNVKGKSTPKLQSILDEN